VGWAAAEACDHQGHGGALIANILRRASEHPLLAALLLAAAPIGACGDPRESEIDAATAAIYDSLGDSLSRLGNRLYVDSNPRAIAQAILCEQDRLATTHGAAKTELISRRVLAPIRETAHPQERARVEIALKNNMFSFTDCEKATVPHSDTPPG
jgi:hypothetical protein